MNNHSQAPDGVILLMDLIMKQPDRAKRKPITASEWFGCGKTITQESWDAFIAARKEYYDKLDAQNTLPGSPAPMDLQLRKRDMDVREGPGL